MMLFFGCLLKWLEFWWICVIRFKDGGAAIEAEIVTRGCAADAPIMGCDQEATNYFNSMDYEVNELIRMFK